MRRGHALIALLVGAHLALIVPLWLTVYDVNDFAGLIAGSRALLAGVDPYDPARWPTAYLTLGTQRPDTAVFGYPPWMIVAFLPLAPLPLLAGSLAWSVGGLVLAALVARRVAIRFDWGSGTWQVALAALTWPAFLVFLQGQWGFALAALAGMCLLDLEARRDVRAGAWWGLALLAKPQLFVVGSAALAVWSLIARRLGAPLGAALVAALGMVAGTLTAPGWLEPWLVHVAGRRLARSTQQPSLAGLAGDVAGELWPVAWAIAVVALGALVLWSVRRAAAAQRLPVAFAGTLALSAGASLYVWSYDHYLAVLAGCAGVGIASGASRVRHALAAFALFGPLAVVLFISAYARWHDTLSGLVPPLAVVLLAAAVIGARGPANDRGGISAGGGSGAPRSSGG